VLARASDAGAEVEDGTVRDPSRNALRIVASAA
jgi:hypothetical protein